MDDLVIEIEIAAAPGVVFAMLTDPSQVSEWLGAGARLSGSEVGAALEIRYPNGDTARGALCELVPARKVVYSWGYDENRHGLAPGATRVTFLLEPSGDGTQVTLRHSGLDADQAARHKMGWEYYVAMLSANAARRATEPRALEAIASYFEAWAERDPAKRAALIARCFEPEGEFVDRASRVQGSEALSQYIAAAQTHMPGVKLEGEGPVSLSGNYARFKWVARMNGQQVASGTNFAMLSQRTRLKAVVGFPD